jgi:hypothetical protein
LLAGGSCARSAHRFGVWSRALARSRASAGPDGPAPAPVRACRQGPAHALSLALCAIAHTGTDSRSQWARARSLTGPLSTSGTARFVWHSPRSPKRAHALSRVSWSTGLCQRANGHTGPLTRSHRADQTRRRMRCRRALTRARMSRKSSAAVGMGSNSSTSHESAYTSTSHIPDPLFAGLSHWRAYERIRAERARQMTGPLGYRLGG